MASYDELKSWLYDLQVFGIKLGLSSTEALLARLGRPERTFPAVHLAGTNGKGSTARMMAQALEAAGLKVGLYTSPHLVNMRERFLINGRMPSRDRLAQTMARVRAVCDNREPPTFFEFTTALAFLYFMEEGIDIGVIECGLGGRLDATNVLTPKVSLIMDIGLEHTEHLGETLKQIAWEKAGIIKPGVPVVTAAARPPARDVIAGRAEELGAPLYRLGRDFFGRWTKSGLSYRGLDHNLSGLTPGLLGRHQGRNAAMALAGLELLARSGLKINEDAMRRGLAEAAWPGRLQVVAGRPRLVLDGAHNPAACRVMVKALDEIPHRRTIIVLGSMSDKDHRRVLSAIAPAADRLILTRAAYERSATPETLAAAASEMGLTFETVGELMAAIERGKELAGEEDLVVVTGSLFIVGEALDGLGLAPVFEES